MKTSRSANFFLTLESALARELRGSRVKAYLAPGQKSGRKYVSAMDTKPNPRNGLNNILRNGNKNGIPAMGQTFIFIRNIEQKSPQWVKYLIKIPAMGK